VSLKPADRRREQGDSREVFKERRISAASAPCPTVAVSHVPLDQGLNFMRLRSVTGSFFAGAMAIGLCLASATAAEATPTPDPSTWSEIFPPLFGRIGACRRRTRPATMEHT